MTQVRVLVVGIEPTIVDFSDPALAAHPELTTESIQAGLDRDKAHLIELGYAVDFCMTDYGATAGEQLRAALAATTYDLIVIGAGIRLVPNTTDLFETLVNIAHAAAPQAKFCFNTNPADTAAAVQRWAPTA